MQIVNYNPERAESNCKNNDKTVKSHNKVERIAFYIKSACLIVMSLCIIAMCFCATKVLFSVDNVMDLPILLLMVVAIGCCIVITSALLMTRRRPKYVSVDDYDNLESQYHRIAINSKCMHASVNNDNTITLINEDNNREVRAYDFRPRHVQKTDKIKTPTLDLNQNCLFLPI